MSTLYATITDLQNALSGTDSGTGTPVQLNAAQLTLALTRASNTVSVYAGNVFDGSNPQAVPPDIFRDLTLDLAGFWAWKIYLKGKSIPATHPAFIAYSNAMDMLRAVRKGEIRLDVVVAGGIGDEVGAVYNRIPPVFTGDDSNTAVNPYTGTLQSDTPYSEWTPGTEDLTSSGPVYQG